MREKVNARKLREEFNIWGYISERFGIYISKKPSRYFIHLWRDKEDKGTLFFIFLRLRIIYIPLDVYNEDQLRRA